MEEGNGGLVDEVIDCTLMLHTMSSVFAHCLFCLPWETDFDKTTMLRC